MKTLGEVLERVSCTQPPASPMLATFTHVSDMAVHPNDLLLFSKSQYKNRQEFNMRQRTASTWIPEEFEETAGIDWVAAGTLPEGRTLLVPAAYCYLGPDYSNCRYISSDTNGCAVGRTREQALIRGFYELIERDAVGIWWYSRARVAGINNESIPYVTRWKTWFMALYRDFWLLDLTSDLEVPVVACVSCRGTNDAGSLTLGFGCDSDLANACSKALFENLMLSVIYDYIGHSISQTDKLNWLSLRSLKMHDYLFPLRVSTSVTSSKQHATLSDCMGLILQKLLAAGLKPLAHDYPTLIKGWHCSRAICPGLRHFWPRFAPGRLYKIPADMGLIPQRLNENDLNPYPLFP